MTVALLDSCVLYPASLRDLFMWLVVERIFEARWTDEIHEEWIRSVLEDRPDLTRAQLDRTSQLMDNIDPASLVAGYEHLIETVTLPDENDRHVLAAAVHVGASAIVTFNLSDFPESALAEHALSAIHPDDFLCTLLQNRFRRLPQRRFDPPLIAFKAAQICQGISCDIASARIA